MAPPTVLAGNEKGFALVQLVLKTALACFGWHALLTKTDYPWIHPGMQFKKGVVDAADVEYAHTELVFVIYVLVMVVDVAWHIHGPWSVWAHHAITATTIAMSWMMPPVARFYMVCYGLMETVAPFYQFIKLRIMARQMRQLALGVNVFVRLFFNIWSTARAVHDLRMRHDGKDPHNFINPAAWTFFTLCGFALSGLDYVWSQSMIESLRKHEGDDKVKGKL